MAWRDGAFIRPLLGERKASLQGYLQAIGQPWMEDESNAGSKYKRNRVRHQLVPLLNELSGGPDALLARIGAVEQGDGWCCQAVADDEKSGKNASSLEQMQFWRPCRALSAGNALSSQEYHYHMACRDGDSILCS